MNETPLTTKGGMIRRGGSEVAGGAFADAGGGAEGGVGCVAFRSGEGPAGLSSGVFGILVSPSGV